MNARSFRHALAIGGASLLALFALSKPAVAAPLCAGPTSVADLGAQGCVFENLTFSGFNFSGSTGTPFSPIVMNPADILVNIFAADLNVNILERIPGIALEVTPRDPAQWTASGLFTGVNLALDYIVSAAGAIVPAAGATFDRYQIRGTGIGGSLRGGSFSASLAVDAGSAPVATGSLGPFQQIGTVTPGVRQISVTTTGRAVQGLTGLGTTFIGSVRNTFTLNAAPVPAPGTLGLGILALLLLRARRTADTASGAR